MKRGFVLAALVVVGAVSLRAARQAPQGQAAPRVVESIKVRDNLYMLTGGGGNTAVFIGATSVTLVDTKNPGYGQPIIDKVKELTPKPIVTIINTHTHGDHVSGNVEFPATVDIIVQENTAANMKKMAPVTGLAPAAAPGAAPQPSIFEQNNGRGLPKRTYKDSMTIGSGDERIELHYFGRAHTNGDTWVVFPALRVVHAGDAFAAKSPPIMDANNGGTGIHYAETLNKAYTSIKNVDTIINGHITTGPSTFPELKEYADYVADLVKFAETQMKAGKTVDEAAAAYKVPERFKGYAAAENRVKPDIQVIYNELKK